MGTGKNYYLDAQSGNDTAAGTTSATAWKTLSRITAASLSPGDVVALRRGQTFTGSATLNGSGTSSAPITVTAFGTGTPPTLSNPTGWNMLQLAGSHIDVTQLRFANGVVFDNADGKGIASPKYKLSGAVAVTDPAVSAHIHDNEFTQVGLGVKTYAIGTRINHNSFHAPEDRLQGHGLRYRDLLRSPRRPVHRRTPRALPGNPLRSAHQRHG
ncbi:hypothetical protein [Streptomyces sp. NPDC051662]|uniref:hypothetical protein n=1 Tax=Streptomyces sp. NPDC051662 TaxID=3154750 RepID=UPI00341AB26F